MLQDYQCPLHRIKSNGVLALRVRLRCRSLASLAAVQRHILLAVHTRAAPPPLAAVIALGADAGEAGSGLVLDSGDGQGRCDPTLFCGDKPLSCEDAFW